MRDITDVIVTPDTSVRDALSLLDRGAIGILIMVDSSQQFLRTVTDGDLRRLMLAREDLGSQLSSLEKIESFTVSTNQSAQYAYTLMTRHQINHVPILDSERRVRGLYLRSDFDKPVPLSTPHLSDYEKKFVEQAFDTNWIAPLGPNVDGFEQEISEYLGVESAAALSSGTAAIHLALELLGVGHGDVVYCPSLTFVASCNPILYQGAEPVFIDSEPGSWNMSADVLEQALMRASRECRLPKAVIVVNLYGHSADFERIRAVCDQFGLPIIEDAAESLGAFYKSHASGTLGDIGAFSFNGNKIITTSGGGMLVAKNPRNVELARKLSTQAKDDAPYYLHSRVGYNYRMSNVLAGIGRGQLKVLNERVEARRAVYGRYRKGLADLEMLEWIEEPADSFATHWLSVVLLPRSTTLTSSSLIAHLQDAGIEARHVWNPMHRQPLFKDCHYERDEFSVSDDLFERGVCLPSGSNMTEEQQSRIIETIRGYFESAEVE